MSALRLLRTWPHVLAVSPRAPKGDEPSIGAPSSTAASPCRSRASARARAWRLKIKEPISTRNISLGDAYRHLVEAGTAGENAADRANKLAGRDVEWEPLPYRLKVVSMPLTGLGSSAPDTTQGGAQRRVGL